MFGGKFLFQEESKSIDLVKQAMLVIFDIFLLNFLFYGSNDFSLVNGLLVPTSGLEKVLICFNYEE